MKTQLLWSAVVSLLLAACATTDQPPSPATPEDTATTESSTPAQSPEKEVPTRPFPADSFHDLLVAEFAVRRNRFDIALGNYMQQSHATRDPAVVARATRLAQFLKADNATLDAATLWTEIEPDNLEGQYTLATTLAKQGRPREALQHMTRVLENGGDTNFPAIAASALRQDQATREQLEQDFDQLLQAHPDNPQLLTGKALLLQQRGEGEQALATIRQVLKQEPRNLQAVIVEARLLQQLDRGDEALARLKQVVSQHPENRRLRLQYARMLMNEDIASAQEQFKVLLESSPADADLLLSVGLIAKETGAVEEAEHYFRRLLATGERDTEAHYYLGQMLEEQQQWQKAIDHYQQIPPGEDFMAAVTRITAIHIRQGDTQAALDYLQDIRQQHPEHSVQLYLLQADVLIKSGDLEAAQGLLTEALLLHPKHINLLYARSMVNEKLGDHALMEQDLEAIIEQDPDNAVALNALGYILADSSRRLDEAYRMIRRALQLKPDDPAILDSLGWVEYRRGNLAQALQLLSRAFDAYPDHEVAAHLGEVLWVLGEKDQARSVWRRGLEQTPDSPIILETLQRLGVESPLPPGDNALNSQAADLP